MSSRARETQIRRHGAGALGGIRTPDPRFRSLRQLVPTSPISSLFRPVLYSKLRRLVPSGAGASFAVPGSSAANGRQLLRQLAPTLKVSSQSRWNVVWTVETTTDADGNVTTTLHGGETTGTIQLQARCRELIMRANILVVAPAPESLLDTGTGGWHSGAGRASVLGLLVLVLSLGLAIAYWTRQQLGRGARDQKAGGQARPEWPDSPRS